MNNDASVPRWVKGLGLLAVALIVLFAIHLLTGGGATHMPVGPSQ